MVSVADSFHAMVTDRPYRRALSYGEAIAALVDGRGRQWDKEVADVMIALAAEDRNSSADANLSALTATFYGAGGLRLPGRRPGDLATPSSPVPSQPHLRGGSSRVPGIQYVHAGTCSRRAWPQHDSRSSLVKSVARHP